MPDLTPEEILSAAIEARTEGPPVSTPATPAEAYAAVATGTASKRNYRAMKDVKLLGCIAELKHGGDAMDRCLRDGCDPQADLSVALGVAQERGLIAEGEQP
jgi:hypothetical protein